MYIAKEIVDLSAEEAFDLYRYVDDAWLHPTDADMSGTNDWDSVEDIGCSSISVDDDYEGF